MWVDLVLKGFQLQFPPPNLVGLTAIHQQLNLIYHLVDGPGQKAQFVLVGVIDVYI